MYKVDYGGEILKFKNVFEYVRWTLGDIDLAKINRVWQVWGKRHEWSSETVLPQVLKNRSVWANRAAYAFIVEWGWSLFAFASEEDLIVWLTPEGTEYHTDENLGKIYDSQGNEYQPKVTFKIEVERV